MFTVEPAIIRSLDWSFPCSFHFGYMIKELLPFEQKPISLFVCKFPSCSSFSHRPSKGTLPHTGLEPTALESFPFFFDSFGSQKLEPFEPEFLLSYFFCWSWVGKSTGMAAAPVVRSKVGPLCTGPDVSRIEEPTCPDVQVRHQKKKFYKSRLNSGKASGFLAQNCSPSRNRQSERV